MSESAFYKEIIFVSETECKDTKIEADSEGKDRVSPLEIFSAEDQNLWSEAEQEMIEKIVGLCGFSLKETKVHHFENTSQLANAFSNPNTKYILLFCDTPIITTINFSLKEIGFSTVANTKVYYNPKVSDLVVDKEAKIRLWNAMKNEFKI